MECRNETYFSIFCDKCHTDECCKKLRPKMSVCFNPLCKKPFLKYCGAQLFCCIECQRASEIGAHIEQISETVRLDNERLVQERVERERAEQARLEAEKKARRKEQLRTAHARHRQTEHGKEMHRQASRRHYHARKQGRDRIAGVGAGMTEQIAASDEGGLSGVFEASGMLIL